MNKNIYKTIALGVVAMLATGCSDSFMDTSSKTEMNSSSYYQTETQAEYALVGCYDRYQFIVSDGAWPGIYLTAEFGSDDALGGGSPTDGCSRFDKMDKTAATDKVNTYETYWIDSYKAINNANLLINQIDNITFSSDTKKATVKGEVYALRALEYFDLVRMFENIPLITTPTTEIVPQSSVDSVYAQIVNDFTVAINNIPADANLGTSNLGRISKYAAEAMLARVYLFYDGVYKDNAGATMPGGLTKAKALEYCENVITSQKYQLESDFSKLWPASCAKKIVNNSTDQYDAVLANYDEASSEFLWVVKFNDTQNYTSNVNNGSPDGNRFIIDLGLRGVTDGSGAPYAQGWGQCPVTEAAYKLFDANDKRRDATIIDTRTLNNVYTSQCASDEMDYTGYVNKKYCPVCYTDGGQICTIGRTTNSDFQLAQDQNWVLMRYSDVLLMAAELGSTNAMKYFNMVRERAYGDTDHDIAAAPTRDQIWTERHKEFMCEGVRYFDLRRQGLDAFVTALTYQGYSNGTATGTPSTVYSNYNPVSIGSAYNADNFRTTRGFWQIPTNQITLSGNVYQQNAGW